MNNKYDENVQKLLDVLDWFDIRMRAMGYISLLGGINSAHEGILDVKLDKKDRWTLYIAGEQLEVKDKVLYNVLDLYIKTDPAINHSDGEVVPLFTTVKINAKCSKKGERITLGARVVLYKAMQIAGLGTIRGLPWGNGLVIVKPDGSSIPVCKLFNK